MTTSHEPITATEIDKLLRFLPLFDVPGRAFVAAVGGGEETGDGAIQVPYPIYHDDVYAFFQAAGQSLWADYGYVPREAAAMLADEDLVANATLEQVKTLLTYCVRGERFGDGFWNAVLESGKVVALLRRLAVLREQIDSRSPGSLPCKTEVHMDSKISRYVVINHEEQYSIWPQGKALPAGWKPTRTVGTEETCLTYIKEVWTDMRPSELQRIREGKLPR